MINFDEATKTLIISAVVKSAYKQKKETDKGVVVKNVLSFYPDDKKKFYDQITPVFANVGKKFTPSWFKKQEFVILKSLYDIPVLDTEDNQITFDEWKNTGKCSEAKINVKMVLKTDDDSDEYSGVIYPVCVHVLEDGVERNPFEGM